jgi:mannose-6-phosphate isomerase-like protein (cupin superfamily)
MTTFDIRALLDQHCASGRAYHEFLRVPSLSTGIYKIPVGGTDPQQPHAEDEVYFVLDGRGRFAMGEEDTAITAGTLLFVPARMAHRFHDITEDLLVLVFFAPAESCADAQATPHADR